MRLSDEQVEKVMAVVNDSGIKIEGLRDDILDHLCCVIEEGLGKSKSFEDLLQLAVIDLAPDGLKKLENKTVFLLNRNRITMLRKVIYSVGFIGALTLTGGVTFSLLHMPGANQLFITGYLVLFLFFIPLSELDHWRVDLTKAVSERLKIVTGVISAIILGLAGLFKVLHLPGADEFLLTGAIVFGIAFLPLFFFRMYKRSVE